MPATDLRRASYSSVGVLIAAMFVLQGGAAFAKNLFPLVGPEGGTTLRLAWASLLLCAAWRPWRQRFTSRERGWLLLYGLSLGGMNLLIYKALNLIPLGVAVAVEFTGPLAVAVLGSRRLLDLVWVVLAVAGIGLLLPGAAFGQPLDRLGLLYALGAGGCWGLYIIAGQRVAHSAPGGIVTALGMTIALVLALPFGIQGAGWSLLGWEAIRIAAVVSLLSSIIPYFPGNQRAAKSSGPNIRRADGARTGHRLGHGGDCSSGTADRGAVDGDEPDYCGINRIDGHLRVGFAWPD